MMPHISRLSYFEVIESLRASISVRLHSTNCLIQILGSPTLQGLYLFQGAYFLNSATVHCHIAVAPPRLIFLKSSACYPRALHHRKHHAGPWMHQVGREALGIYWTSKKSTTVVRLPARFQLTCHCVKLKSHPPQSSLAK